MSDITRNKVIELPCFIGDTVYYIQHPTNAASWCKENPIIVSAKVVEVSYMAKNNHERIRIDIAYKNKLGDDAFTFFIWGDGELYTSLNEAEQKLNLVTVN